jgi:hypothetical protein
MSKIGIKSPAKALFLFHLHVGIRLALRIFIPAVAVFFALYYVLGYEFFLSLMATILDGGFLLSGIFTTFLCLIIASFAARRICLGLNGWIRHLPGNSHTHRRTAAISILFAQLPILVILAVLVSIASKLFKISATPYLAGLPLLGLSCGLCVLPVKQKIITRPMAVLAGICFSSNNWGILVGGVLLLTVADSLSGHLVLKKKRSKIHRQIKSMFFVVSLNWRAIRLRPLIPYLFSLAIFGTTQLFLVNNNPSPQLAERVIRFGGTLSMVVFCSIFTNMLASRRPPWPWVRSLPLSAKSRIVWDSSFVSLLLLPLLFLVGLMNLKSMLALVASLPLFSVYSSYSIRHAPESLAGASGKVLLYGSIGSLFLCLIPWVSLFFLAITPLVLKEAIKAEKHQKVSQWLELHHLAAGDSLSWSKG